MATRVAASCFVCVLLLAFWHPARAEPCDCVSVEPCGCNLRPPPEPETIGELRALQASALTAAIASWIFTTVVASQQEHFLVPVDTIPIAGGISAAVHNPSRDAPLLLFATSTQVMSVLIAVVAGLELAEEKRHWELTFGASCDGAGMMLHGRF